MSDLGVVNATGFPLQIAVQNIVAESEQRGVHNWGVAHIEHAWREQATGDSGFIDLVLRHAGGAQALIVECKRVQDCTWVFIGSSGEAKVRSRGVFRVSRGPVLQGQTRLAEWGWAFDTILPPCPEAHFCAVRGGKGADGNFLERVAGTLVQSVDAFAAEEDQSIAEQRGMVVTYLPVVVTTATLSIADFDPALVDISSGSIAPENFTSKPAKWVRFHKQLSTSFDRAAMQRARAEGGNLSDFRERTVMVVDVRHLSEFLRDVYIDLKWNTRLY